jgi:hypothetical protein
MEYSLIGVCGLYCGACYHYRASFSEGKHLLEEAARQGKNVDGYTCDGCRSDKLYMQPGCAQCQIRACARAKGIDHCGLCAEFPCQRLEDFQHDGRAHHIDVLEQLIELTEFGKDEWLLQQEARWICVCGYRFSWYEQTCSQCGATLHAYTRL